MSEDSSSHLKMLLLKRTLSKLKIRKHKYLEKVIKYRKINQFLDTFCAVNSTTASTCLVLSFSFVGSPLLIISIITSFFASISIAIKKSCNIETKLDVHKTSYIAMTDLIRKVEVSLSDRLHSAAEYDIILQHLYDQMNLIDGNAIPLSTSESVSE